MPSPSSSDRADFDSQTEPQEVLQDDPNGYAPMKELHSDIEIDAPAERVWGVLTDFASYPQWNPFIREISGEPTTGERLEVRIEPPGGRGMTFRPTVLNAEDNRQLR